MVKTADHPVGSAQDQALWREVNERLRDLNEAFEHVARESEFLCECANRNCMEHIAMTLDEYERVRRVPTHFLVLPGEEHFFGEIERVVEEHDGYVVVEKFGDAGRMATKLDPRSGHRTER
jgi:SpoU rRNA methylase family enzyme